jgi:signal transduction histidine kinase
VLTAAVQFNPLELDEIEGKKSIGTKIYEKTVLQLQEIRFQNPNIRYIYIQRNTDDKNILEFVADADALHPENVIDLNNNGKIDEDEELSLPGDSYDVSDYPEFVKIAFDSVYVDDELSVDQWGIHLSSTAPLFFKGNSKSKFKYLIGIDVDVSDFKNLTNMALIPYGLFVAYLLFVLTGLTVSLVRMWNNQVIILRELDRQKDAVVHMVAHQFKGPVTTINFITELLLDGTFGKITGEQKENIATIRAAAQKMGAQSGMVLDAAKITSGKLPIEIAPTDLNELFEEIVEEARNHAKQRKVNLKISLPTSKLPTAILDRKYTQLAIDNLLNNAIKYTALKSENGNVVFTVEIKKNNLLCMVKDTGVGIPKKDQENIFKELFRASNAGKEGTGLGLHVAMGAIEAQGGKMQFESEEGKGTTFIVNLPLNLFSEKLTNSSNKKSKVRKL